MPVIVCFSCGHEGNLPPELLGKAIRCKKCNQTIPANAPPTFVLPGLRVLSGNRPESDDFVRPGEKDVVEEGDSENWRREAHRNLESQTVELESWPWSFVALDLLAGLMMFAAAVCLALSIVAVYAATQLGPVWFGTAGISLGAMLLFVVLSCLLWLLLDMAKSLRILRKR